MNRAVLTSLAFLLAGHGCVADDQTTTIKDASRTTGANDQTMIVEEAGPTASTSTVISTANTATVTTEREASEAGPTSVTTYERRDAEVETTEASTVADAVFNLQEDHNDMVARRVTAMEVSMYSVGTGLCSLAPWEGTQRVGGYCNTADVSTDLCLSTCISSSWCVAALAGDSPGLDNDFCSLISFTAAVPDCPDGFTSHAGSVDGFAYVGVRAETYPDYTCFQRQAATTSTTTTSAWVDMIDSCDDACCKSCGDASLCCGNYNHFHANDATACQNLCEVPTDWVDQVDSCDDDCCSSCGSGELCCGNYNNFNANDVTACSSLCASSQEAPTPVPTPAPAPAPASVAIGPGNCRDYDGKYTNTYVKNGVSLIECESQCQSDAICTHYDYSSTAFNGQCNIFAPAASTAPSGWSFTSGNGATSITTSSTVNDEYGDYVCFAKQMPTPTPTPAPTPAPAPTAAPAPTTPPTPALTPTPAPTAAPASTTADHAQEPALETDQSQDADALQVVLACVGGVVVLLGGGVAWWVWHRLRGGKKARAAAVAASPVSDEMEPGAPAPSYDDAVEALKEREKAAKAAEEAAKAKKEEQASKVATDDAADFWMMHVSKFMTLPEDVPIPDHQSLRDAGMLVRKRVTWAEVLSGSLAKDTASISHRWSRPEHFDHDCSKVKKLKAIFRSMPHIEHIWLDFICAPQYRDGNRTEKERAEFSQILKQILPFVYLGTTVIVLYDRKYNERFWPIVETWSATKMPTATGLVPASADRLRVKFVGMHSEEGRDEYVRASLMSNFHAQSAEVVSKILMGQDIEVTNMSDKEQCLGVVRTLDSKVIEKFNEIKENKEKAQQMAREMEQAWHATSSAQIVSL